MLMKPMLIRIRKKTKVPTKNNLVHQYRYDWKTVGTMDYFSTPLLLKNIDGKGHIETDAQFAKWLKDNYGIGIFSVIAWVKGREGFWGFIKVQCNVATFQRLRRNESAVKREKNKLMLKYKELKSQNPDDESVQEQIEDIEEDNEMNEIELDYEKNLKNGPGRYLKTLKPIYREHLYDGEDVEEQEEAVNESLW